MREKKNYKSNCNLESNVIDLHKAKKKMRSKRNNSKEEKANFNIKKINHSFQRKNLNKYKTPNILLSSIYKRVVVLLLIFVFATGTILICFKFQISENIFLTRFGTKSLGKVIDTVEDIDLFQRGERIHYRSTIEFKTLDGKNIEFQTGAYRDFYKYDKDAIEIVYNTENPKMARVYTFNELVMPIIYFTLSTLIFISFFIYALYFQVLKKIKNFNGKTLFKNTKHLFV